MFSCNKVRYDEGSSISMLKALLQILAISSRVSSVFRGVFSGRCCGEYSENGASTQGLAKSRIGTALRHQVVACLTLS